MSEDNEKRGKSVGREVHLPQCVACGAYAVADNVGVCLKCGEKSFAGKLLDRVFALERRVAELERDASDPVKHNIRIGGSW